MAEFSLLIDTARFTFFSCHNTYICYKHMKKFKIGGYFKTTDGEIIQIIKARKGHNHMFYDFIVKVGKNVGQRTGFIGESVFAESLVPDNYGKKIKVAKDLSNLLE